LAGLDVGLGLPGDATDQLAELSNKCVCTRKSRRRKTLVEYNEKKQIVGACA